MPILSLFLIALFFKTPSADRISSFSIKGFSNDSGVESDNIRLFGDAKIEGNFLRLTSGMSASAGRVMYKEPFKLVDGEKVSKRKVSFSTYFSFSISPEDGDGLAFYFLPTDFPIHDFDNSSFGVSPELWDSRFKIFAVEFDTLIDSRARDMNGTGNNSIVSVKLRNVSSLDWEFNSGKALHAWIDYEAGSNLLEVRLSISEKSRPDDPLLSYYPIDLSDKWKKGEVFVGLSSSNRNSSQTCSIYSWSFRLRMAPHWLHSQPFLPGAVSESANHMMCQKRSKCLLRFLAALTFGVGCGTMIAFFVLFARSVLRERRGTVEPEEFAVCPKEFEYKKIKVVVDKETIRNVEKQDGV